MALEFCYSNGIKPSEFEEWSGIDRAAILGYSAYKNSLCQQCGSLSHDWIDEDGEELKPGQEAITLSSRECPGCVILDVRSEGKDIKSSTKMAFVDKE